MKNTLPGYNEYEAIVVNDAPMLGMDLPYHCNCGIYEPKSNYSFEQEILDTAKSREELKQKLETGWIQKLVPDYIVKLIQKHNILKNKLTKEDIYDSYIRLILDSKFGFEESSEQKK